MLKIVNKTTKKLRIALVVLFLLILSSCGSIDNCKTIEIDGYGIIKVPEKWEYSMVDGFIYLSFEENGLSKHVLVQYRSDKNINDQFSDIEEFVMLKDENFSNSTGITKNEVHYLDGSSLEMFSLSFTGSDDYKSTEFLCLWVLILTPFF